MSDKNIKLPLIALRGMTVLPGMVIHFDISRKKSIHAVEKAMATNQRLFLSTQRNPEISDPVYEDLYETGTMVKIQQLIKLPDNIIRVLVEGLNKGHLTSVDNDGEYLTAQVELSEKFEENIDKQLNKAMISGLMELIRQYAAVNPKMSRDIIKQWMSIKNASELIERISIDYPMEYELRQEFLGLDFVEDKYEYIAKVILEDINVYRIKEDLTQKVRDKVDKHQKEYILREQLKVLSSELDGNDDGSEIEEFTERTEKLAATEEVKEKIRKEIKRYKILGTGSSESNVERGYIETLLDMPWDMMSEDNKDLDNAQKVLNEDHYGMEKVKERILESLAVRNITNEGNATIICLAGPPGTGKTSIAKSVARALNKEYVRICLGGVRDEAEIRGHRKTYVGAMPGRIINGLKSAGVKNPLMLLDEIDKISSDYKGDTASALLEVLDSEQNSHFVDHYIELPTDLSQVLFIATANDLSEISRPLLDRMEIIELNSYTENEKLHIAKEHLVSKALKKNGLSSKQVKITDKALFKIISGYTKEAGVRNLERQISKICRKSVRLLYNGDGSLKEDVKTIRINDKNLEDFLGKVKYKADKINKKNDVGIVRGLAWTSVGGDTLEIEVNTMPGKGELILTGNMGDVMKESARIALTYARSIVCSRKYGIDREYFDENSIHMHIPEGAVPKDGPSAGITMATAIISAVTGIPVYADVAMTGEVTLRGRVLPIGGLKEKLLAAKNAGVKKVLVPVENLSDVEELDEEITDGMQIVYVSEMKQVIDNALVK